jgi:hypothetical protein
VALARLDTIRTVARLSVSLMATPVFEGEDLLLADAATEQTSRLEGIVEQASRLEVFVNQTLWSEVCVGLFLVLLVGKLLRGAVLAVRGHRRTNHARAFCDVTFVRIVGCLIYFQSGFVFFHEDRALTFLGVLFLLEVIVAPLSQRLGPYISWCYVCFLK